MIPRQLTRATAFPACLPAEVEQSPTMPDCVYDVTIATCDPKPHPDPDEPLLLQAFDEAGLCARVAAWDDPQVDWSASRLTVIRSTWDYYRHPDDFLGWVDRVAEVSEIWNPADVVRWNHHKGYLQELGEAGISVVPTEVVECGSNRRLSDICAERGWSRVVVKPAVSAGSNETHLVDGADAGRETFRRLVADRDTLVQPYLEAFGDPGERSIIWIDGEYTHEMLKRPRFDGEEQAVEGPFAVEAVHRAVSDRILDEIDADLLYARVDVVEDAAGEPMVTEVEVIEPSLFLKAADRALARLVAGVDRLLASESP